MSDYYSFKFLLLNKSTQGLRGLISNLWGYNYNIIETMQMRLTFFFYEGLCCKYSKDTQNSRVIANINVFQLH